MKGKMDSPRCSKAAEKPWVIAEQPEDDDKDTPSVSTEGGHTNDRAILLKDIKEVPERGLDGERVVQKVYEDVKEEMPSDMIAEDPEAVEQFSSDCGESEESDVLTAEAVDVARPGEEPSFELDGESDEQDVPSHKLPAVSKAEYSPLRVLVGPTKNKLYSQFEEPNLSPREYSVSSASKPPSHGTDHWWKVFTVCWKTGTSYNLWSLLLLLLLCCGSNASGFRERRSALTLRGSRNVFDAGSNAHFYCYGSSNSVIQWLVNGSPINEWDIDTEENNPNANLVILTINNISTRLNNARLQCYNGVAESNELTLQIRGPTSPPSLAYDGINHIVSWSAEYSLRSNATYCLEIYVLPSLDVLRSMCGWNKTYFSVKQWSQLLVCGKMLTVQITAESSAGNITSENITIASTPEENNITDIFIQAEPNTTNKTVYLSFTRPVCFKRTELVVDGVPMIPSMVEGQGNVISVTLPDNKVYDSLIVRDTGGEFTASAGRIVTYDVLNIEVEPGPNMLNIGAAFLSNTSALGVFYVVIPHNELGLLNFDRSYHFRVKREIAEQVSFSLDVPPGEYLIHAYDIEWDGQIQRSGLPADTKYVTVNQSTGGSEVYDSSDRCSIVPNELFVDVTCYCEFGYYQVVLLGCGLKNITTKQQGCSKSVSFKFESGKNYSISAFHEDSSDGVFRNSLFFKFGVLEYKIGDPNTTHIPTTKEKESSNSKKLGTTVSFIVIGTIIAIFIVG